MIENPSVPNHEYDTVVVSFDYTKGEDKAVMLVGTKRLGTIKVINYFYGKEAVELHEKLVGKKTP